MDEAPASTTASANDYTDADANTHADAHTDTCTFAISYSQGNTDANTPEAALSAASAGNTQGDSDRHSNPGAAGASFAFPERWKHQCAVDRCAGHAAKANDYSVIGVFGEHSRRHSSLA